MSKIIKDRILKSALLKYFVSKRWYPHLEADIYCIDGTATSPKLITDIDVLGLYPENFGKLKVIVGDCKTLKNQSPITRALWMNGIMNMLDSQQGIILLEKKIEQDHKLAATELNISVLSGNDFEKYARCTSRDYDMVSSATCVIESWDQYYSIHKMFPKLKSAIEFVKFGFWNKRDYRLQLRHTLSVIRDIRNELNPDHPIHLTLVSDLISLFSVALSEVVANIFNQYLLPETKKQLSDELKVLIWGGRESYTFINSLYSRIGNGGGYENEPTLSLPEWDMFIQLVRQCLESPYDICKVPMILREVAFEYIAPQPYEWAKVLASENLQAAKFSLLIAEYVCRSSKIPPEFLQQLSKRIIQIQA